MANESLQSRDWNFGGGGILAEVQLALDHPRFEDSRYRKKKSLAGAPVPDAMIGGTSQLDDRTHSGFAGDDCYPIAHAAGSQNG